MSSSARPADPGAGLCGEKKQGGKEDEGKTIG